MFIYLMFIHNFKFIKIWHFKLYLYRLINREFGSWYIINIHVGVYIQLNITLLHFKDAYAQMVLYLKFSR